MGAGMNHQFVFSPQPFAEGRFRSAYKGTYQFPHEKAGQNCVVKRKKSGFTWEPNGWDMCIKIQEVAQMFAQVYVGYCRNLAQPAPFGPLVGIPQQPRPAYQITFTKIDRGQVSHGLVTEYVIVEDYLHGNYTKWVNNCGGISPASEVLPAFCHWSWVHTKGEMMIADLQGVRRDDIRTYILTDPAILTASGGGELGGADTGIIGMVMFFINHTCNPLCCDLPRPTWEGVKASIPAMQLQISPVKSFVAQLANRNTVFAQELTALSPDIKAALIHLFKRIAQGN